MEKAAWMAIAPALDEGDSSVGTKLSISHLSASPVGLKVWAESEVTAVDGKRIEFKVTAGDEKGLIGEGTHERFIITNDRFLAKAARKLEG
jgi:predicted thioesterase